MSTPTPTTAASSVKAASAAPRAQTAARRLQEMLEAPITPTLLRLSAPTMFVMILQASATALDAYYISWLGENALAAVALVFPLVTLMQTMAAAGMGGGVASAVARALGAGRRDDATGLVVHAVVVAAMMAAVFTVTVWVGGGALFSVMGGAGVVHDMAMSYSTTLFSGAVLYWLFYLLSSVVRGTGNMALPAWVTVMNVTVYAALSPSLIMGWGPFPALGILGAPLANISGLALASSTLAAYLFSSRSPVRPSMRHLRIHWQLLRDILRVGVPASMNPLLANLMVILVTGLVGQFGALALAGFGIAARLEYLLLPLIFGFGAALVTMVGANIGAGKAQRALRTAWIGATLTAAVTGAIGITVALVPSVWIGLFSDDPTVHAIGGRYLAIVGPTYAFFGFGLALYFASQGAGRVLWPLFAGCLRVIIGVGGGWVAIRWLGTGLSGLFATVAASIFVFGSTITLAVKHGAWHAR